MKKKYFISGFVLITAFFIISSCNTNNMNTEKTTQAKNALTPAQQENADKLVILWTSADKEVAENMVFMYTLNSRINGWWEDVTFIVWGPSADLLASDSTLQSGIKKFIQAGIKVEACKACADNYGVGEKLQSLGIDVKYMGTPLTGYIKDGYHILTF
jgi:hypothetical protein